MGLKKLNRKTSQWAKTGRLSVSRRDCITQGMMSVPTVAIMTLEEARTTLKPNQRIAYMAPLKHPEAVKKALMLAHSISRTGKIKLVSNSKHTVLLKKMNRQGLLKPGAGMNRRWKNQRKKLFLYYGHPGSKNFRALAIDTADGSQDEPYIFITIAVPISFLKRKNRADDDEEETDDELKKKDGGSSGEPPERHVFLEAPRHDEQIIEAIELASSRLLNRKHTGFIERKAEVDAYKKPYNEFHLLVCMFFYIHIHELNANYDFYSGQRATFHKYCENELPDGFDLKSRSYFTRCINNLETKGYGFENYLKAEIKPKVKPKIGEQDLFFWHEIYQRAAVSFTKVLIND